MQIAWVLQLYFTILFNPTAMWLSGVAVMMRTTKEMKTKESLFNKSTMENLRD